MSTRRVRGEECRNKVRCRDRVVDGKSVREGRQADDQTIRLDLDTCYHAKMDLAMI